jgi:hypothetical protein
MTEEGYTWVYIEKGRECVQQNILLHNLHSQDKNELQKVTLYLCLIN